MSGNGWMAPCLRTCESSSIKSQNSNVTGCEPVPFMLSLSEIGNLASLTTGPTAMKKARTVLASSTMLTGTISTALTASASSVNTPLAVSNFGMSAELQDYTDN